MHPTWIEIDLPQFRKNIAAVRKWIGKTLYCLPVKANAYGHGLCAIGREAAAAGVDMLAVAHLQEGIQLRNARIAIPILVLGAIHEDQIQSLIEYDLEFSISSRFKAELVREKWRGGKKCRIHLEVDTGMKRTGMRPETAMALYREIADWDCMEVVGIYSHFATADAPNDPFVKKQIEAFTQMERIPAIRHLCNSGGTVFYPEAHLDMVRPSLLTFGYGPKSIGEVAPCFSLKSKVSYFKVIEAGEGISYGHTYKAAGKTRIATIPIGYGDGYRRALSNKGMVLIRGRRFPIVGNICMDQLMVDVGQNEVYVGDEAVLIGKQGNEEISLHEIASLCDTIPYEVLCSFNERIPRIYTETDSSDLYPS